TSATSAASAANASKDTAASAAASAAGYAGVAKAARDEAIDYANTASTYAANANTSKSAAATSATTANNAKTAAQTAEANALTAYEGTLNAYSSVVEMYDDLAGLEQKAGDALATAQSLVYKTTELEITDGVTSIQDPKSHTIYHSTTPASSIAISWPTTFADCAADVQYITNFMFTTAATMGESTWGTTDQIYWSGNDCATGIFIPTPNVIYDIIVVGNGTRLRGYVSGMPVPAATA
ncbi:MAG: hypothetical protein IJZ47_12600, partial [Oscillospiraceae bacterium]|nr:hypothetical protein [Oscillospiraceae bacterium]